MGNRHSRRRSNVTSKYEAATPSQASTAQSTKYDLDDIVEQWVWSMWNRTKTKALSHYKPDELLIRINWKCVTFIQSNTHFDGLPPLRIPQSRVLFRTSFANNTTSEQSHSLKAERSTQSTLTFTFSQSLTKSQDSNVMLRLPNEIAQLGGGMKREQSVGFGQDTVKEYRMRWNVNSQIRVAPQTRTYAELSIDEEEFSGRFSFFVRFSGRITATIATRQCPDTCLQFIDGDIVQIIREFSDRNSHLSGFEFVEENPSFVQFTMYGKCLFRYGVEQNILLRHESLNSSSSVTPTEDYSSNYRVFTPEFTRPLQSHIEDEEIL